MVRIYPLAVLIADDIKMDADASVEPLTLVYNLKRFCLGRQSSLRFGAMVFGHGSGSFQAGDFCMIGLFSLINCSANVTMGDYCGTAARCTIYSHGNYLPTYLGYLNQYADVNLGNYVWLHINVVVLPGVTIGDHVMVYSHSLVAQDIQSGTTIRPAVQARQVPTERLRLRDTPAFRQHWYKSVWGLLRDYAEKFGENGTVEPVGDRVVFTMNGRRLELLDAQQSEIPQIRPERNLLLTFRGATPEKKVAFRRFNWIDFESCHYHFPRRHSLHAHIIQYLQMCKAHYFSCWTEETSGSKEMPGGEHRSMRPAA